MLRFFKLPQEEKIWLISCCIGSLVALFAIHLIGISRLTRLLGKHKENLQLCTIADTEQCRKALRIGQLMEAISKRVPWRCLCLSEALCVKWLLNRLQIPAVFYLGAHLRNENLSLEAESHSKFLQPKKSHDTNDVKLKAHAWVCVGPYTVIGAPAHKKYQITATFFSDQI